MSKYINAEAFIEENDGAENSGWTLKELIENFPTADVVEVVHGQWIMNDDQVYECKECGYVPSFDGYTYFNYCPNCGARMDGGKED